HAYLLGIEYRDITLDDALCLQAFDPAQAGTGRQGHAVGKLLVAQAPFALQLLQDTPVCPVKLDFHAFLPYVGDYWKYYCSNPVLSKRFRNLLPRQCS